MFREHESPCPTHVILSGRVFGLVLAGVYEMLLLPRACPRARYARNRTGWHARTRILEPPASIAAVCEWAPMDFVWSGLWRLGNVRWAAGSETRSPPSQYAIVK